MDSVALLYMLLLAGNIEDPLQLSNEEFKKITKINFMSVWYLFTAVSKRMRDSKLGGSIVFLTTIIGAERGLYQGGAAYGSCLAAIHQLARVSNMYNKLLVTRKGDHRERLLSFS